MSRQRCRNKDVEKVLKAAEKLGATVKRQGRSGHFRIITAKGAVTVAGTPSRLAPDRMKRDLRRIGLPL